MLFLLQDGVVGALGRATLILLQVGAAGVRATLVIAFDRFCLQNRLLNLENALLFLFVQ